MIGRLLALLGASFFAPALWAADALTGEVHKQPLNVSAIVMFVAFVGATLCITYWASKRNTSTSDFYTAGGSITGFQNGLAIAGDYMSAASFLGISALVFTSGYDGLIYSIGFLVGWPILTFLMAERLRNLGRYTFADIVSFRLDQTRVRSFAALGGVARRGIYDNMKTAIDKVGRGKERDINARFLAMASHYLFELEFCNPASGWEKGQVEKNVQDARHRLWQPTPRFPSLAALNDWLEARCKEFWAQTPHGKMQGTIADLWAEEVRALMPASRPFDGFVEYTKRVTPTCLVHLERNRYSVPASFANRPVSLRVYPDRVVVAAEGMVICEHRRIIDRSHDQPGKTVYDWRHYLAVVQRKPGALRNGAPFLELPEAFITLQQHLLKKPGGDREMVDILALVLQHDEDAVLLAVEMALETGVPTKTHVLNLLHRLVDGKSIMPPTIDAPQALMLVNEPQANVERYDALRTVRHAS